MDAERLEWYGRFPVGWWGFHPGLPRPLSAVELVEAGALDWRLMATVWAVMARRRSLLLASEAPMAGKTTLLSAAVDFLPAGTVGFFLRGWAPEPDWTDDDDPEQGYLLVSELSDHLPIYVWGDHARQALALAERGYGLGATLHADSLDEALAMLRDELGASDAQLAALTLYLQFSAYRTPAGIYRRVEEAWHLRRGATAGLEPVRLAVIEGGRSPRLTGAQRLPVPPALPSDGGRAARPLIHDPEAYAQLAGSLGLSPAALDAELKSRAAFLQDLAAAGVREPAGVARAVSAPDAPQAAKGAPSR